MSVTIPSNSSLSRPLMMAFLAVVLALPAMPGWAASPTPPAAPGTTVMDTAEDATEDAANWLLGVADAVRQGDWKTVADSLSADFSGRPLPSLQEKPAPYAPGIRQMTWSAAGKDAPPLDRDKMVAAWRTLFGRYKSIDDLLFKVKSAEWEGTPPATGRLRIFLTLVGTGPTGLPEDLSGWWGMSVKRGPKATEFVITGSAAEDMRTLVAERAVFSEVSRAARLGRKLPRFGTQGNLSFQWRGAATADVDNDGDLDLFAPGSDTNSFYINRGDGTFEESATAVGLAMPAGGTGTIFLDYDNDGDKDLFVARLGTQLLFQNQLVPSGKLLFLDVSDLTGVDANSVGFSPTAADIDNDGDLDVFVASYALYGKVMPNSWYDATNGTPNLLFVNNGNGTFSQLADRRGLKGTAWSYAASFADYDQDGDQDLYVANDYGSKQLYRNKGDGTFEEVSTAAGVADPGNGMGVYFGDYNRDGLLDIYSTNMSSTAGTRILKSLFPNAAGTEALLLKLASGNTIFRNNGDGTFADVSKQTGGTGASWGWGGGFIDINNDGWEDVFCTNGFISGKSKKDT